MISNRSTQFAFAAAIVLSGACAKSDVNAADTRATIARATAERTSYTKADFARLRWLIGDWRGRNQEGNSSYIRYRLLDDSTIRTAGFSDSTFKRQKDSATVGLRGGLVIDQGGGTPWIATRLDSNGVNFASEAAPANHFIWARTSDDEWFAHIFTTDRTGTESRVLLKMERVKRK